jgi:hypothetical protein
MKAQYLGKIVKATGGTAKAADHILTVAEFGTRYLIPKRNLQPLYKIYLVDVYLIYGAILCGTAVILRTILSVILTLFQTKEKEKTS